MKRFYLTGRVRNAAEREQATVGPAEPLDSPLARSGRMPSEVEAERSGGAPALTGPRLLQDLPL